jgi:hypothetical protein
LDCSRIFVICGREDSVETPKTRAISTPSPGFSGLTGWGTGTTAGRMGLEVVEDAEGARFLALIFSITSPALD